MLITIGSRLQSLAWKLIRFGENEPEIAGPICNEDWDCLLSLYGPLDTNDYSERKVLLRSHYVRVRSMLWRLESLMSAEEIRLIGNLCQGLGALSMGGFVLRTMPEDQQVISYIVACFGQNAIRLPTVVDIASLREKYEGSVANPEPRTMGGTSWEG